MTKWALLADTASRAKLRARASPRDPEAKALFRFLHQKGGKLSRRAREKEFAALRDEEVRNIEAMYREIFTDTDG